MKIANRAPQHLSNYEVLQHFIALKEDNDYLQEAVANNAVRQALNAREQLPVHRSRIDKEPDLPEIPDLSMEELEVESRYARRGISSELIWVQDEVIKYLCAEYNITARQTPEGVSQLADRLQDFGLRKGEVLNMVNLAPQSAVDLTTIIDEVESRLAQPTSETMQMIIDEVIAPTLLSEVPQSLLQYIVSVSESDDVGQAYEYDEDEEEMNAYQQEEFVHEAAYGAGHEGGVDDEEDNGMD